MNSTISKDFFLYDSKIAANTSLDISDYGRPKVGMYRFDFWIQAVTKGLKKVCVGRQIKYCRN